MTAATPGPSFQVPSEMEERKRIDEPLSPPAEFGLHVDDAESTFPSLSQTLLERPKEKKEANEFIMPLAESRELLDDNIDKTRSQASTLVEATKEAKPISKHSSEPRDGDSDELAVWNSLVGENPNNIDFQNRLADAHQNEGYINSEIAVRKVVIEAVG